MRVIQTTLAVCLAMCIAAQTRAQPTEGGDYAQHLRNLFTETHQQELQRLRDLLARKDLNDAARKAATQKLMVLEAKGQLLPGYYGELISVPKHLDYGEICLLVVSAKDGGLDLLHRSDLPDKTLFAHIKPGGKIVYANAIHKSDGRAECSPKTWPIRTTDKQLAVATEITAVSGCAQKKPALSPPPNTEGFFYRLANDWLISPSDPDTAPTDNIIWCTRRPDGGLDLVHAGPEDEGLYATVSPDFVIHETGAPLPIPPGNTVYWEYMSYEGLPGMGPGATLFFQAKEPPDVTIDEFGYVQIPGDVVE